MNDYRTIHYWHAGGHSHEYPNLADRLHRLFYLISRLFAVGLAMVALNASATAYVNGAGTNGNFSDGATWVGGTPPTASNDSWTIGGIVNYDTNNANAGWAASVVNGTLDITNGVAGVWSTNCVYLKMLGNLSGTGNFFIGRSETPVPHVGTNPAVVVAFTAGGITMTKAAGIQWYGEGRSTANGLWTPLAVDAAVGTNIIYLTTNIDVRAGDVISVGSYSQGANATLHVVASVNGTTVTLDPVTNYFGGVVGTLQTNITTSVRSNLYCGVCVLTRPILYRSDPTRTLVAGASSLNGTVDGVRVYLFDAWSSSALSGWIFSNSVFQAMSYPVYMGATYSSGTVQYCLSWGNNQSGFAAGVIGGSGLAITQCVSVNNPSGVGGTAVRLSMLHSTIENAGSYAIGDSPSFHLYGNCSVYNSGTLMNDTAGNGYHGNVLNSVSAYHCGSFAVRGYDTTYINCKAINSTAAGFLGGTAPAGALLIGCTVSNNTTANFLNKPVDVIMINCTNQSSLAPIANYLVTTIGNRTTVWKNDAFWNFYCGGGTCTSQASVVSGAATGFTMKHLCEVATYQSRWYDDSTIRAYGTGRWTVYLRRESLDVDQRACIVQRPYDPAADNYGGPILVAYTNNTVATGTWTTVDLSYSNPNSYPIDVRMSIGSTGNVNSVSYSSAIKQNDEAIRIMP